MPVQRQYCCIYWSNMTSQMLSLEYLLLLCMLCLVFIQISDYFITLNSCPFSVLINEEELFIHHSYRWSNDWGTTDSLVSKIRPKKGHSQLKMDQLSNSAVIAPFKVTVLLQYINFALVSPMTALNPLSTSANLLTILMSNQYITCSRFKQKLIKVSLHVATLRLLNCKHSSTPTLQLPCHLIVLNYNELLAINLLKCSLNK